MAITTDTWGWYASGLLNLGGDDAQTLGGNSYDLGTGFGGSFRYQAFGTMQMYDINNDGLITDTDIDDGTLDLGDRFITPDGIYRQVNEIVIYQNSVLTYTLPGGATATWTTDIVVWQLGNGDLVIRTSDTANATAPADFNAANVTNITLGTWDGTDYSAGLPANFDQAPPLCFASGTLIMTRQGAVPVETLRIGSEILTLDHGYQPLRWIGSHHLSAEDLRANPDLRPICIRAGALGEGQPEQDLLVSPQHRVLIRCKVAERMFGACEVLVAAKQLLALDGIEVADHLTELSYWHVLFDDHHIVISNGAATESLFTGPEALKSVTPEAREEIFALFPELRAEPEAGTSPARPLVPGRRARKLASRVVSNKKRLLA